MLKRAVYFQAKHFIASVAAIGFLTGNRVHIRVGRTPFCRRMRVVPTVVRTWNVRPSVTGSLQNWCHDDSVIVESTKRAFD